MNYNQFIQKLFHMNRKGRVKLDLLNMELLCKAYHNPQNKYKIIHVAGTNGKGSVTTKIAAGLQTAGFKTGLYTSPHISTFRERIQINGAMISKHTVEDLLNQIFHLQESESLSATFFEITTLLAFKYFADSNVDYAVLETGLGGRLDATNVVRPILSVITSISLDHTDILGKTIESITKEKAGIIKPNTPVIIGPQVDSQIIKSIANSLSSSVYQVSACEGSYDEENKGVAKKALQVIGIPNDCIEAGLNAIPPCRMETFYPHQFSLGSAKNLPPAIILDVGHNPDGLLRLFSSVKKKFPQHSFYVLCGLSKGKDLQSCFSIILDQAETLHLIKANNDRAASIEKLQKTLLSLGISPTSIESHTNISEALKVAIKKAGERGQILLVCGTFFIMAEIRESLGIVEPRDVFELNEQNLTFLNP